MTPVVKQDPVEAGSAAYHGYWGLDFTTVDPHLGTDQDFADLVAAAHALGLKVYLDVVVNHTADVVQLANSWTYSDIRFRDCHGRFFNAARYVTAKRFPCLAARYMPEVPYVAPADRHLKKPEWLNDPLNYHDRGNIDFGSCSQQCFEQGDFYGLDDLFTEKPNVMNGLAQIYASWIARFHVDGFRVDTAKHVNAAFFRLWVPKIRAAARSAGIADFPIFGEVTLNDAVDLRPSCARGGCRRCSTSPTRRSPPRTPRARRGRRASRSASRTTTTSASANGIDPAFPTFLGNHDMGRAAQQILSQAPGLERRGAAAARPPRLRPPVPPPRRSGRDVRGRGRHDRLRRRQGRPRGHVPDPGARLADQSRVGSPPIGKGSSFEVDDNPIEARLRTLSGLRDRYPALATGASVVRYAKGPVLVVSRIDAATGTELVEAFNNGSAPAT